ncbi:MAG: DNA-directed RNA polymerase subunit omega [Candidatus Omnitrophica bacterium]|nr:DNA-directed RNA polymerase subunit omega [Candidatus Omnitrophota bacterium]
MAYIALEKLTKQNKSLFRLVLAAADRANEINSGAKPLIETASKNPTSTALQEFAEGKVCYEEIAQPQEQPKPAEEA